MEKWEKEIPLSRKNRRTVSDFFAEEMLYDYLSERLDEERRTAVEKVLAENRDLKKDLDKISQGQRYAESLKALRVPPAALEAIDEPDTYMSVLLKKTNYERWPLTVKWGMEALIVLSALLIVLVVVPWDQALKFGLSPRGRQIILAEVSREKAPEAQQTDGVSETSETIAFEDEDAKKPSAPATVAVPETGKEPAAAPSVAATAPPPAAPKAPAVAAGTAAPGEGEKAPVAETVAEKSKKPGEGALFRGDLAVTNLTATSPKIQDKIIELGGRKAGEVELGWKKTPTSAYFHFTMPEAKYEELTQFLREYGAANISKQKHPRVMPDGIIRLILTVEEAKK
ncbi:MAG: hypothetical protein KF802_08405 [Bdellovibrionaceae bacterium]|nr:hypothetical protein [Pseudobdellovibrionaceae bacterium]